MSCDQHVVKIQLKCRCFTWLGILRSNKTMWHKMPLTKDGSQRGYKPAHPKHPMTMWVASSLENYMYACKIGIALTLEYTRRYVKVHTCARHLMWLWDNHPSVLKRDGVRLHIILTKAFPSVCPSHIGREGCRSISTLLYG